MCNISFMEKLLDWVEVEWRPLGKVADLRRGKRLVKSQLEEAGHYAVNQNSMAPLGYYHECNVKAETAFVIAAGAAGEIGYSNFDFWVADDVYFFLTTDAVNQKYFYHFLLTKLNNISSQVRRASVPRQIRRPHQLHHGRLAARNCFAPEAIRVLPRLAIELPQAGRSSRLI